MVGWEEEWKCRGGRRKRGVHTSLLWEKTTVVRGTGKGRVVLSMDSNHAIL